MPATSKRQFRFMQAVAHGSRKADGLSKKQAAEYIGGQENYKKLPETSPTSKKKKGKMRHGQY